MDLDTFYVLPPEIVEEIAMNLEYNDLFRLSQTSTTLSALYDNSHILKVIIRKRGYQGDLRDMDSEKLRFLCRFIKSKRYLPGEAYFVDYHNMKNVIKVSDNIVQVSMCIDDALLLRDDGQVYRYGEDRKVELVSNLHNIVQVSLGDEHALFLRADGQVYISTSKDNRTSGLWNKDNRTEEVLLEGLCDIVQVSAGGAYSLFVRADGKVYGYGNNIQGQLGLGDEKYRHKPELIPDFHDIVQVSASGGHSLCLRKDGRVYAFGNNAFGRLGLGISVNTSYNTPQLIPDLYDIVQICVGYFHSLCLSKTGQVYGFGSNAHRQMGMMPKENKFSDKTHLNTPRLIPYVNDIVQISASAYNSLFLTANKQVYIFNADTGEQEFVDIPEGKYVITSADLLEVISSGFDNSLIIVR